MSVEIAAIGVQRPVVLEALEQEFVGHKVWEAPDRAAACGRWRPAFAARSPMPCRGCRRT